ASAARRRSGAGCWRIQTWRDGKGGDWRGRKLRSEHPRQSREVQDGKPEGSAEFREAGSRAAGEGRSGPQEAAGNIRDRNPGEIVERTLSGAAGRREDL